MNTLSRIFRQLKSVTPATWVRLAFLLAALVNIGFQLFGIETLDLGSDTAEKVTSFIVTVLSSAAAFWKNNSFSEAAQEADEMLKLLRSK